MLPAAIIIFLVLPVLAVTGYFVYCEKKQKKLRNLFRIIQDESSNKSAKERAANQAIQIMHANKWLIPPEPILLNIRNPDGLIISYELLRAEIRYLLHKIDKMRDQKTYLSSVTPINRSAVLKFLQTSANFLDTINFIPLDLQDKNDFLLSAYNVTLTMYLSLPDENAHQELNFIPLFQIIDKTSARAKILFPLTFLPA